MPYGQGSAGAGGWYDSASGQHIDPNYGKGQMPGTVDPEHPYQLSYTDKTWIDKANRQAEDFSARYYNQVAGGGGYGEAMLRKGLGRAQNAMASQAVSRGANPLAERAAILGGGQMMRQGSADAAAIRAQEMATAAQARQSQLNQNVALQQWYEQMERQRQMAEQQHYAQMSGIEVGEDQYQASMAMQGVGMGVGAAGAMASDIKLKDGTCIPSSEVADKTIAAAARESPPAYHGVTIADDGGYGTRYTSRFSTPGNEPLPNYGERDEASLIPDGAGVAIDYRPSKGAPLAGVADPAVWVNPTVEAVKVGGDPMEELGKLQASYAAAESASNSGGIMGGSGAGSIVGAAMSDIQLKDGTCVPSSAVEDANLRALAQYRREERLTHEPMGRPNITAEDIVASADRARRSGEAAGFMMGPPRTVVTMTPKVRQFDLENRRAMVDPYQPYSSRMSVPERGAYDPSADAVIADVLSGRQRPIAVVAQPADYDDQAAAIYAHLAAEGRRTEAELDRTSGDMHPKTWHYKPSAQRALGLPGGQRVGPMAQDLERSKLGRLAVVETPAGKAIDRDAALGLSLGLHGRHGERDDAIESRVSALEKALKREGAKTESKL